MRYETLSFRVSFELEFLLMTGSRLASDDFFFRVSLRSGLSSNDSESVIDCDDILLESDSIFGASVLVRVDETIGLLFLGLSLLY